MPVNGRTGLAADEHDRRREPERVQAAGERAGDVELALLGPKPAERRDKRLRGVGRGTAIALDLLGEQAEVARVADELVEQGLGALDLASLREARDQPERAEHERALLAGEPVGVEPLLVAVAQHQPILG